MSKSNTSVPNLDNLVAADHGHGVWVATRVPVLSERASQRLARRAEVRVRKRYGPYCRRFMRAKG